MTHSRTPLLRKLIATPDIPEQASSLNNRPVEPALSPDERLNLLADVCLETYNLLELQNPHSILPELLESYPEVSEGDLLTAIQRARDWHQQGGNGVNAIH